MINRITVVFFLLSIAVLASAVAIRSCYGSPFDDSMISRSSSCAELCKSVKMTTAELPQNFAKDFCGCRAKSGRIAFFDRRTY